MTLIGLDFDNTLVHYDKLFHQLAVEKGLIPESLSVDKTAIRNYLRSKDQEQDFTLLQGQVYGLRILEAEPAEGVLESLMTLKELGVSMVLVSHKTKVPFKGPPYDLRKAALDWLSKYGFFSSSGIGWSTSQVYFEDTKASKVSRICSLECTHYVDDLPEILSLLPVNVTRILYDPNHAHTTEQFRKISYWGALKAIISNDI